MRGGHIVGGEYRRRTCWLPQQILVISGHRLLPSTTAFSWRGFAPRLITGVRRMQGNAACNSPETWVQPAAVRVARSAADQACAF